MSSIHEVAFRLYNKEEEKHFSAIIQQKIASIWKNLEVIQHRINYDRERGLKLSFFVKMQQIHNCMSDFFPKYLFNKSNNTCHLDITLQSTKCLKCFHINVSFHLNLTTNSMMYTRQGSWVSFLRWNNSSMRHQLTAQSHRAEKQCRQVFTW